MPGLPNLQLHRTFRNPSQIEPFVVIVFALRDADPPANGGGADVDGR